MPSHSDFLGYYDEYKHKVFSFLLYRVGGDRMLAEDLTSDVFLKAYQRFETYNTAYAFSTWIYTIARNTCIDHIRKHKQLADLEDAEEVPDDIAETALSQAVDTELGMTEVYDHLLQLPGFQRECIILKYLNGLSTSEIAEATNQSEENVRQALSRGIRKLRTLMTILTLFLQLLIHPFLA